SGLFNNNNNNNNNNNSRTTSPLLTHQGIISYFLFIMFNLLSLISLAVEDKCEVAEFEEKQK
ncbi:MAG UNVERIFIED_CONTAM: hypothetical protein MIO30_31755, partial [Methylobacterium ajmalii]